MLAPRRWTWNRLGRLLRWARPNKPIVADAEAAKDVAAPVADAVEPSPLAQPVAFVGLPNPFNIGLYLKAAALIVVVGFGAYRIGLWQGEGRGYAKRDREVAAERAKINGELDALHAALDEALAKLEAGREQAAADVAKTLKDIPPSVREKCSKECSIPASTRSALEAIQ
jgi:hypothetical protein